MTTYGDRKLQFGGAFASTLRIVSTFVVILALWEAAVLFGVIPSLLLPPPHLLLSCFVDSVQSGEFVADLAASSRRYCLGLAAGSMIGVLAGLATGRSPILGDTLGSVFNLCRSIPSIALIPISIIFMGIGDSGKVFIICWGATFPIWIAAHTGVSQVDLHFVWAARSLGVRGWKIYPEIYLPAAMPGIFAGLRISVATGFFGLAAAEMSGASAGIAFRIFQSHSNFRPDKMLVAIITIALLSLIADRLITGLVRFLFPWHHLSPVTSSSGIQQP